MYIEDINLVKYFHLNAGHSKNTIKTYNTAFNKYCDFHGMSLTQLINEAEAEQKNNVPTTQLKIYDRLMEFKHYLIKNHTGSTISTMFQMVKTFYKHNRIDVPYMPPINSKRIKHNPYISYWDLLTKEEIIKGLEIASDNVKSWIMVMLSSGATRVECSQITNKMFFKGTAEFHKKDNILDAFKYLSENNAVCTLKLIRKKTQKPYYTFLNPETVSQISASKLNQKDIKADSKLLKHTYDYIGKQCKIINDYLDLGYAGGYSRFRPHMFRKYHSTHLSESSLTMDEIDQLQGRGKGATREAYYKNNPEILKLNYIKSMNNISIYNKYDFKVKNRNIIIVSR